MTTAISWTTDEQQISHTTSVYDATILSDPITITKADLDTVASLRIGQNREDKVDPDAVDRMLAMAVDGAKVRRLLVWRLASGKYILLDGNHRMEMVTRLGVPAEAFVVQCDETIARKITLAVNLSHGRSSATPEYTVFIMRMLREEGLPTAQIGRMIGYSAERVATLTRRDEQQDRAVKLLGKEAKPRVATLDVIAGLEDAHVQTLGVEFLSVSNAEQKDIAERIKQAPSAARDGLVHEIRGEVREILKNKNKVKARTTTKSSRLQVGTTNLLQVGSFTQAFFESPEATRAKLRDQWRRLIPMVEEFARVLGTDAEQRKAG